MAYDFHIIKKSKKKHNALVKDKTAKTQSLKGKYANVN